MTDLSINKLKFIVSLKLKKNRDEKGLFVAEGKKLIIDFIRQGHIPQLIVYTDSLKTKDDNIFNNVDEVFHCSSNDMKRMTNHKEASDVLAVFKMFNTDLNINELYNSLSVCLESIQDPGNLGTIIRTADWFGINNIICSENCVDMYNPKVVQASMGSISRVKINYLNIKELLINIKSQNPDFPIYGAFMDGIDMKNISSKDNALIIFGNEGNGISSEIERYINKRITIPRFPADKSFPESLNVSVAMSIIVSHLRL